MGRIAHATPRGGPGLRRALAGSHVVGSSEDAAAVTVVRGCIGAWMRRCRVGNLPTMRADGWMRFGGLHPPYGAGLKPGLRGAM